MNILVISPHPDDETLGAGGTLLNYKDKGHQLYWLNITNMKEEFGYKKEAIETRQKQIELVKIKIGFTDFYDLGLEPANLDQYRSNKIIEQISKIIGSVRPEIIIIPNGTDAHSDHKIVFEWCCACTKIFRYPFIKRVMSMEIISETNFSVGDSIFVPNYYVDITKYMNRKEQILGIYESELGEHPFPRSLEGIEALAKVRGMEAGVKYSEAYHILKIIE